MDNTIITQDTVRRLILDIKEVSRSNLSKDGIYYKHDENNMLKGYCIIIGPNNTPYSFGYYAFKFNFPNDYPHSPPTLQYMTNDGLTRFHPNYYKDGKVCISALNTWKGEQWTACCTIKSILLILCSLFTENPLINEPGIAITHKDILPYNKIITYKNIDIAISAVLNKEILPKEFDIFNEIINNSFLKNYNAIMGKLKFIMENNSNNELATTGCYNLRCRCNYSNQKKFLEKIYIFLNKNTNQLLEDL